MLKIGADVESLLQKGRVECIYDDSYNDKSFQESLRLKLKYFVAHGDYKWKV